MSSLRKAAPDAASRAAIVSRSRPPVNGVDSPGVPWHAGLVADDEPEDRYAWLKAPLTVIRDLVPERYPILRLTIPTQIATLAVAYWLTRTFDIRVPPMGCEIPLGKAFLMALGLELAFLVAFVCLKTFVKQMKLPGYLAQLIRALKKTSFGELAIASLSIGFVEEVAFRGVLLPLVGPVLSTVIFAAAHRPQMWIHWLSLTALGGILAFELSATGGLLVPILHHAIHDFWALALLHVVLTRDPDATLEGLEDTEPFRDSPP
jgi:membrane protease YdiL (CAAX protease family)